MIKFILKKIITFILKTESRLILWKYKPKIIAVTGSVGKTSAKDAIATALSGHFYIRKSEKSYNSEIGVPLTIIGGKTGWGSALSWLKNIFKGIKLLAAKHDYPKILVLEMGVDRPKDMKKLVSWARPDMAVITAVAEVPVHVEYFKRPEDVAREKARLIEALKEEGTAVLNGEDKFLKELEEKTRAKIITFGFSDSPKRENFGITASNYQISGKDVSFKVDYKGNIMPVRLNGAFGRQAVYAALSAIAVGAGLGLNVVEMAESLARYQSPPGRMRMLKGIKRSHIIDDTYNSSPLALSAALDALSEITAKRKIAVLGDMLELGKYTIDEHKKAGEKAAKIADIIFTVGPRAKFIAEGAKDAGFRQEKIFSFSTSDEAKGELQKIMEEGDLILIKGSQGVRMEKIVEEVMAHPEQKEELLVRQEKEWLNR